ncbi:MAG: hypothetical protein HY879_16110 [Deltaproteobacteria bacterium]|nr:hypothetical protein [Deltaproteobacteria bacterium]
MDHPIMILHIDKDYQAFYWILRDPGKIISQITIPQAMQLLKTFEFDLIVSEPQNLAILKSAVADKANPEDGDFNADSQILQPPRRPATS